MKKKLIIVMLLLCVTLTGCNKKTEEEKKEENFKIENVYHYLESYQDTIYIIYSLDENIIETKLLGNEESEYQSVFDLEENDINGYIKDNNKKALLFYITKADYNTKKLELIVTTEENTYKKIIDLDKAIEYTSVENFKAKLMEN